MNWLVKTAASDKVRVSRNIQRLEELREQVHDLAYLGAASQSGAFKHLQDLMAAQVVLGRPLVLSKMKEALIGENNQKVVLDAPTRFSRLLFEAESLVKNEIGKERKHLRELENSQES